MKNDKEITWTKEERTNVLPLRWFANAIERPAHFFLERALRLDDVENFGIRYKIYSYISNKLYKPALKWGTYYSMEMNIDDVLERSTLENSEVTLRTHKPEVCTGQVCTIHNRTDHNMRSFPQHWRSDRRIMERICSHGVGHPDPDEFALLTGKDDGTHGCDGCCSKDNK